MKLGEWKGKPDLSDTYRSIIRHQLEHFGAKELAAYATEQQTRDKLELDIIVATDIGLFLFRIREAPQLPVVGEMIPWRDVRGIRVMTVVEPDGNLTIGSTWRIQIEHPSFSADGGGFDNPDLADFARACLEKYRT